MSDARMLDELSGFDFEDVMEDVFRNLGYENVRQAARVADKGRDITMEEVVDGTRRAVVVECKHTDTVSRPVVQKLHSAVATYDYDGPKRGMVATTGRFTGPAQEYADSLRERNDPYPIELLDGRDIRELAEEVGLDLYNGRIEIICDETLRPFDPATGVDGPLHEAFRDIGNIENATLPTPYTQADFRPVVLITAAIQATFETSVGVVHQLSERDGFVVEATRGHPSVLSGSVQQLVERNSQQRTTLDEAAFVERFDEVTVNRFGQTETEYKEWAVDQLIQRHTTTVSYTGGNNVTYEKTCEPRQSDIAVQSITPLYLPQIRQTVELGQYTYPYEYYAAGPSRVTIDDGIHRCVQCETAGREPTYTYCTNCGSINCEDHIKTERLEGTPVCTGCAVTERFALKMKYFYDERNREQFQQQYEEMPIHEKAQENLALVAGVVLTSVLLLLAVLTGLGVV